VTLRWDGEAIFLQGECPADEAEELLELVLAHPAAPIDWACCRSAHTAVVQVLLAAGRPLRGLPEDEFLRRWIPPLRTVSLGP
jgi:hypothetical protein